MDTHHALVLAFAAVVLLVAWLPLVIGKLPLSLPMICVAIGYGMASAHLLGVELQDLLRNPVYEQVTEAVLLIALMGAGLKIDRPFGWRRWATTWRLLGIGMPLMIGFVVLLSLYGGGFSLAAAVFLGGALAPTDPVLASDVAVGPPGVGEEGEVRFGLTSEAGLNDGLAFPVVSLGLALAAGTTVGPAWLAEHVMWKLALAGGLGWAVGWAMGWLTFRAPHFPLSSAGAGLVAIGVTALSFALTEGLGGYGFIAVFVTALTLRSTCPDSEFHIAMADFSGQVERVLVMIVLVLLGGALGAGLLHDLTWRDAALGLVFVLVGRPLSAGLALIGSPHPFVSRATTAFFGIRGIGTLYYMVYASQHGGLPEEARLSTIVGFVVLCSIVLHGLTSTPLMRKLDEMRQRAIREGRYPAPHRHPATR